jgi:diguanylate cyclase (GGDEF)-like protein/PAS domain S-box-containing protein
VFIGVDHFVFNLSWNPVIPDNQRATFERQIQSEGFAGFHIRQMAQIDPDLPSSITLIPARRRSSYVPIVYIEPMEDVSQALGFDTASDPSRAATMRRAASTGQLAVTGLTRLVNTHGGQDAIVLYMPVFGHPPNQKILLGYLAAAISIDAMMVPLLRSAQKNHYHLSLLDISPRSSLLYPQSPISAQPASTIHNSYSSDIQVDGSHWRLVSSLYASDIVNQRSPFSWWVLVVGMLFTALSSVFLLTFLARRIRDINRKEEEANNAMLQLEVQASRRLVQMESRYRNLLETAPDAIVVINMQSEIVLVNAQFERQFGYKRYELVGQSIKQLIPEGFEQRLAEEAYRGLGLTSDQPDDAGIELVARRKDGSEFPVEIMLSPIENQTENLVTVAIRNISIRKDAETRLRQVAHFDTLTGLPNRRLFQDSLTAAITHATSHGWLVFLLFLDLDHFKEINDQLGHAAGDELLKQVGQRLLSCLHSRDTVGRLGGDEFGVILLAPNDPNLAITVATKIHAVLSEPFELEGHAITTSASIGITVCPTDSPDPDVLVRYADMAMYEAKKSGRNAYRFYTQKMNVKASEKRDMEKALREAVVRNEFSLYYQPKISLSTGQWIGVEALLRWNRPNQEMWLPDTFVPSLESIGLIRKVGHGR